MPWTHCSFDRREYTFAIGPVEIHGLTRDPTMLIFDIPRTHDNGRMDLGFGKGANSVPELRKLSTSNAHVFRMKNNEGGTVMIGLAWVTQITAKGRIVTLDISNIRIAETQRGDAAICPLIDRACLGSDCEMWGEVYATIDPKWTIERQQQREERASKSWWWRLWHPEPRFGPLPRMIPVNGCTLKTRGK